MELKQQFVSIIVPAYNVQDYIGECIESILIQSFSDFELLLVDDGSKDRTGEMCDEYAKKDDRIKVIHKTNGGLVSARKSGLMEASGEYVCYVDGDDWIAQDTLETLCTCAKRECADIVIADFVYVREGIQKNFSQEIRSGAYTKKDLRIEFYPRMLCTGKYYTFGVQPSLCAKIIKREILLQNQLAVDDRIKLGEDAACSYACYLAAEKVFYLKDKYVYFYRIRPTSISHSIRRTLYTEEIEVLINHLEQRFKEWPDLLTVLEKQLRMYTCYMVDNMLTPYISFGQLFFGKELKDSLDYIRKSTIGKSMLQYCNTVRTSSRAKRILHLIEKPTIAIRVELLVFRLYEKLKN